MPSLTKLIAVLSLVSLAMFGMFSLLNSWHYRPIKQLKRTIADNRTQLKLKDTKINSLYRQLAVLGSSLNTCENNLSVQAIEGYIDGIEEEVIENPDFNASTIKLHT